MTRTAKIKTLIADNELLARRRIRRLLAGERDVEVIGECDESRKAISFIKERRPDLVFLDMHMPGLADGFGVLESIPPNQMPAVIFLTAYDQPVQRAFEVHGLDCLLKPFDRPRFQQVLNRARSQIRPERGAAPDRPLSTLLEKLNSKPKRVERIVVKSAGRIMFLRTDEIDWIEAADNYVRLHVGAEAHPLRETLGSLEARLNTGNFIRIHRSTVVNIDRLRELQPCFHGDYVVILQDGTKLNLSRTYRNRVVELLGGAL